MRGGRGLPDDPDLGAKLPSFPQAFPGSLRIYMKCLWMLRIMRSNHEKRVVLTKISLMSWRGCFLTSERRLPRHPELHYFSSN